MSTEGGTKAVIAAMLANLGIAVTKFIAFLLTGFSSMLAESIHSVADTSNQVLLLLGGKRAKREATPEHPFGYGRERYVYSFIVAIILFSLGGLFALYEAWHKYQESHEESGYDPFESRWWWVPLVVLTIGIALEGWSFRTAVVESNKVRGRRSWLRFVRSSKSPELPVILLEDFGALIGLVLALFGVGLTLLTSNPVFDALGTAAIGVLLVVIAIFLAVEMKSLLLGESAMPHHRKAIFEALESPDTIDRVIHLRTQHLGPEEVLVAAKVAVGAPDQAVEVARAIDEAERAARAAVPDLDLVMYIEPDIDRGDSYQSLRDRDVSHAGTAGEATGTEPGGG